MFVLNVIVFVFYKQKKIFKPKETKALKVLKQILILFGKNEVIESYGNSSEHVKQL